MAAGQSDPPLKAADLSHSLAAGTVVPVQLNSVVDSSYTVRDLIGGRVTADVKGTDGRVALSSGSVVTINVRESGKKGTISTVVLGLYSVNVQGAQYALSNGHRDAATLTFTEDAGKGQGHTSVHLPYHYDVDFKLDEAIQLH
jgi:hypothetical protein